jgi:hypothetical protein
MTTWNQRFGQHPIERLASLAIVGFLIAIGIWLFTGHGHSFGQLLSSLPPWSAAGKYDDVRWLTRGLVASFLARLYLLPVLRWVKSGSFRNS